MNIDYNNMSYEDIISNWVIHYVTDYACDECGNKHDEDTPWFYHEDGFANIHTHGLDKLGLKDMCICLDTGFKIAGSLLNHMGVKALCEGFKYKPGIYTDILVDNIPLEIIEFENDPTLYLILPDENGKLPDDKDCADGFCRQKEFAKYISDSKEYV